MAKVEDDRNYTRDHEWAMVEPREPGVATVGITDYAQKKLGDIVMVEMAEVGTEVEQGEAIGTVESPKSVSDIYAPVSGVIVATNELLEDAPDLVNAEPYGDGWMVRIKLSNPTELEALLDGTEYTTHCAKLEEA
jgi:glycine cleavage system H protein